MGEISREAKEFIYGQLGSNTEKIGEIIRFLNKKFCVEGRILIFVIFMQAAKLGIDLGIVLEVCQKTWTKTWCHQTDHERGSFKIPENKKAAKDILTISGLLTMFD